ncbi:hypothetical protein ACS0TY_003362 [Phlomoides rotata]
MIRRWFANDDIPTNILSRLSAKKLHNLKNVSKEWHNLVSDRSFVSLQLQKREPVSGFFFQEVFQFTDYEGIDSISYIPVDTEILNVWRSILSFLPENVVIMSLNNGLLCCRSCFPISDPRVYVCNPLNRQYGSVEWPNLPRDSTSSIALVFDPSRNPIDKSTDFKLVAVSKMEMEEDDDDDDDVEEECCFLFYIYSSKTGLWTRSKEFCPSNDNLSKNKGVLVEGVLYWHTDGCKILMFDPQSEVSLLISSPLPETEFDSIPETCIGESHGKLCYVIISEDGLQEWTLEDCFMSHWELKISIPLYEFEKENPIVGYKLSEKVGNRVSKEAVPWMDPLAFKDGMLLLRVSAVVYLFQFDTRMMKRLCDVSSLGPKSMFSPIVVPYTMSLVPIGEAYP